MKRKLSTLSIGICMLAMLFFEYGFWQLSYLTNIRLASAVRSSRTTDFSGFTSGEISSYAVTIILAHIVGYFIAAVLSFVFSERKRIDLYESLVAFGVFWALHWIARTSWKYLPQVAQLFGTGLNGYWFFLVNGAILTIIGTLFLFVRKRMLLQNNQVPNENTYAINIRN